MNPKKKQKKNSQKGNWNSYQLFKISQQNAKNWIFRNLPGIDLYPAGTLGPLGVKLSSRLVIEGSKVVALAPATITIRGSTFHPRALMSLISD